MRLGFLRNPNSLKNRKDGPDFAAAARQRLGSRFAEPAHARNLAPALADFAEQGVDLLVIDGGDGVVHRVATALPQAFGAVRPKLIVLPSGNTNLVANDVGWNCRGLPALDAICALADSSGPVQIKRRASLDVHWLDGVHHPVSGLFFGAGAFTKGADFAHGRTYVKNVTHDAAVAGAIFASFARAYAARKIWMAGDEMLVAPDNGPAQDGRHFLFMASTLDRLIFGIKPFWDESGAHLRYLDIVAHPKNLIPAAACILWGRIPKWLRRHHDFRSGGAPRVALTLNTRFFLDGETYAPGPSGQIELRAGPMLEFVVPQGTHKNDVPQGTHTNDVPQGTQKDKAP